MKPALLASARRRTLGRGLIDAETDGSSTAVLDSDALISQGSIMR